MANVFDGDTKQYLESVNTAEYTDDSRYAINPTMPGGVPYKYVKVVSGAVYEMNQTEKDAVDAAAFPALKASKKVTLKAQAESHITSRYPDRNTMLQMLQSTQQYRANRSKKIRDVLDWIASVYEDLDTKLIAAEAATDATELNAVQLASTSLDLTAPANVSNVINETPSGWTGDGSETTFVGTLASTPTRAGSVVITATATDDSTMTVTDDSAGTLTGDVGSGNNTADYATSDLDVTFSKAVKTGTNINVAYRQQLDYYDLADVVAETDDTTIKSFIDANAESADSATGISGPLHLMQTFVNRRELYNDVDNPLYVADFTPLVGAGGSVTNLNTIHDKLGWHRQEVLKQGWRRPLDLLVYYGWLNSFNSGELGWDNEKVAQAMARYDLLVFGDGVQDPGHGDYSNTTTIIARIKALNPCAKIFGYVSVNQTLGNFQTKVGQWNTLAVHGIFMDEAGYDFGKTRAEFNTCVDYVHDQSVSNLCFANAWNTDHVLGTTNDPSYPNATYNPTPVESNLTSDDWIMLESLAVNTTAYSGNDGYASKSDWAARISKMISLRATYGVNFAALGVINNGNADGQDLYDFSHLSSMMGPCEAHGTSDTSYGSGSAAVTFWDRPSTQDIDDLWSVNASVQVDASDADVYYRYVGNARISADWSASAQVAAISRDTTPEESGPSLGDWNTLSFATDYLAATDGFVVAGWSGPVGTNEYANMQGKTDGSSTPTTIRAACSVDQKANILYSSMTMPVRAGDYWRVDRSGTEGTQFLYWVPLSD